jgi:hypothetical protein
MGKKEIKEFIEFTIKLAIYLLLGLLIGMSFTYLL